MRHLSILIISFLLGLNMAESKTLPLKAGEKTPDTTLYTQEAKELKIQGLVKEKPTVLIFYRGGWCPYCTKHLSALSTIEEKLIALGYQIVAVSPDSPAKIQEMRNKQKLTSYTILSDSDMETAKAFGIAFQVPPELVAKYKNEYHIDIEADSGRKHHLLPHPAVYIIGTDGQIDYSHVNEDYKSRLDPAEILQAAKSAVDQ